MVRKDRASQEDTDGGRATACVETRRSRSEARGRDPREYRTCIGSASSAWVSQTGIGRASVQPVSLVCLFRGSVGIIGRYRLLRSDPLSLRPRPQRSGASVAGVVCINTGAISDPQSGFKRCTLSRSHPLEEGRV